MLMNVNASPLRNRTFGAIMLTGTERKSAVLDGVMLHPVGPRIDRPMACRVIAVRLADAEPDWAASERRFEIAGVVVDRLNIEGWEARLPAVLRGAFEGQDAAPGILVRPDSSPYCVPERELTTRAAEPHHAALRDAIGLLRALFAAALVREPAG
jgi:hypothetical protein